MSLPEQDREQETKDRGTQPAKKEQGAGSGQCLPDFTGPGSHRGSSSVAQVLTQWIWGGTWDSAFPTGVCAAGARDTVGSEDVHAQLWNDFQMLDTGILGDAL